MSMVVSSSKLVQVLTIVTSISWIVSAKIDFIKKPLIKRLLAAETKLNALQMKELILTRAIVNDNHLIKELTSTDSKCNGGNIATIKHDEHEHLICEQGPANIMWGFPVFWSEHYIGLDFILSVLCGVVCVGAFSGLILAFGHSMKKDRDRKLAAEKAARDYAARCREKKRNEPRKPLFTKNTTLNQDIVDDQPPVPYSEPILDGGLRSNNGISTPTYATSSSHQLLRVTEQQLETNSEYRDYMKSISAHVVDTVNETGELFCHDEQLVSEEASTSVGDASRHALAVTEIPGLSAAHDGGDSHDLFGGMHPPPVHIRDKEELMAFGAHLLDEMDDIVSDEPTAPASHLALHLVSMSSILVGSGTGELPSMFACGESALACGDRLRCLAEGFLISPHTTGSAIRRSTMIRLAENALEEYERALASSKAMCRAHVAYPQGICLYILGRYLDALKSFNEALAGPQKARAWHAKGKLLASQGDLAGSEHCLLKAMEVAKESNDFLLVKSLQTDVDTVYDHLPEARRRSSTTDLESARKGFALKNKELKRTESGSLVRHNSMRSMEDREEVSLSSAQRQAQAAVQKVAAAAKDEAMDKSKELPKKSKWGILRNAVKATSAFNSKRPSFVLTARRRSSITDTPPDIPMDLGQAVKEWQRRRSCRFYHVDEPEEEEDEQPTILPELRRRSSLKSPKTPRSSKSPREVEPSHESEGWERQSVRAGHMNSEVAAEKARRNSGVHEKASDVFTSPVRRATVDGDEYLPPFTLEICSATIISAIVEQHARRGSIVGEVDADATYKVIATVVDEVHGARPLQDQELIVQSCMVSPTLSPDKIVSPQSKKVDSTALGMMASETLTHLDHAFQTNTTSVSADSEKVSVVEVEDQCRLRDSLDSDDMFDDFEDDVVQQQTTTTGLKWKEGGMLTICGARTDSLIVLTLMKQTNIRDEDNPNMIERKGVCLGQVGVPLTGLTTALKMVQGRIVLACTAELEHPSIWLRHEGPSSNQRDDWGIAGSLLSPTTNKTSHQTNMALEEESHVSSCSVKFRMHSNALLDTLEASRSCGASDTKEPPQNMIPYVPCALALLNPSEERDVMYGEGIEELYMVALTADRIICCVYDELGEPRSFKAVTTPLPPQNFSQVKDTTQTQDAYSMSVFCTNGGPKSLFALRHNREFPLKRLTSIREVSGPGCDDPRLELKFWLHVMDASHHEHGHGDSAGMGIEAKVLLGGNSKRRASMHARRSSIAASAHLDHAIDHGEEYTKVVVVLRFKRDRKKQIRSWANALKKAVHLVPGSIFSMEHALADGGDPDRPVLAPMNQDLTNSSDGGKHVLFTPLSVSSSSTKI